MFDHFWYWLTRLFWKTSRKTVVAAATVVQHRKECPACKAHTPAILAPGL